VLYCNAEHRIADESAHAADCREVLHLFVVCALLQDIARSKLQRNVPWETACRLGLHRTSDYLKARAAWAAELARIQTVQATQEALGHYLDNSYSSASRLMTLTSFIGIYPSSCFG
jgi:hypothetical protein